MGIKEAISKGFGVAKKSLPLIIVLFVAGAALNVLNTLFAPPVAPAAAGEVPVPSGVALVIGISVLIWSLFSTSGTLAYSRDSLKTGAASVANFMAGGSKYFLKLLLLALIVFLIGFAFVMLVALLGGMLNAAAPGAALPIAVVLFLIGFYFIIVTFFFAPYAIVIDEKGVKAAIKASMKLVKKNILKLLGILAIAFAVSFGLGMLIGGVLAGLNALTQNERIVQIGFAVLSALVTAFVNVFIMSAITALYLALPDRNNA
jgi:hypothetical protein